MEGSGICFTSSVWQWTLPETQVPSDTIAWICAKAVPLLPTFAFVPSGQMLIQEKGNKVLIFILKIITT